MRCALAGACICVVVLGYGCTVPTLPVATSLRLYDTFSVGGTLVVHVYECWDSTQFVPRYIPVFLFRPLDPRAPLYVAAWQEYLTRFAGPLRRAQKELVQVVLDRGRLSDSVAWWRVPTYRGEVSDLRHVTPVRNRYWSLERYHKGEVSESAILWLRSSPQEEPWEWHQRPPGFWHHLQREARELYPELKRHVEKELQQYVAHSPLAP